MPPPSFRSRRAGRWTTGDTLRHTGSTGRGRGAALTCGPRSTPGRGAATQAMARAVGVERKPVRRLWPPARPRRYQRWGRRPARVSPDLAYSQRRVTEVDSHAGRRLQALKAPGDAGGDEMVQLAGR